VIDRLFKTAKFVPHKIYLLIAEAKYEFIFEFKYEKKAVEKRVATIVSEAREQMLGYLAKEELLNRPKMKAWGVVVVGDKVKKCVKVIL